MPANDTSSEKAPKLARLSEITVHKLCDQALFISFSTENLKENGKYPEYY
jgi:hypothetical protein